LAAAWKKAKIEWRAVPGKKPSGRERKLTTAAHEGPRAFAEKRTPDWQAR
jgi:hypothetical protein